MVGELYSCIYPAIVTGLHDRKFIYCLLYRGPNLFPAIVISECVNKWFIPNYFATKIAFVFQVISKMLANNSLLHSLLSIHTKGTVPKMFRCIFKLRNNWLDLSRPQYN